MGLDIYFHIVSPSKNSEGETTSEAYRRIHSSAKRVFSTWANKEVKKLEAASEEGDDAYRKEYKSLTDSLPKWFKYSFFYEGLLGGEPKSLDDVKEYMQRLKDMYLLEEAAYFRKVNFIYAFFSDRLIDECCFASKFDIKTLRDTCEAVLSDHKKAKELLPTQSGFFFGSTDYDDDYFDCVADCAIQMQKVLTKMKDKDKVLVVMSW